MNTNLIQTKQTLSFQLFTFCLRALTTRFAMKKKKKEAYFNTKKLLYLLYNTILQFIQHPIYYFSHHTKHYSFFIHFTLFLIVTLTSQQCLSPLSSPTYQTLQPKQKTKEPKKKKKHSSHHTHQESITTTITTTIIITYPYQNSNKKNKANGTQFCQQIIMIGDHTIIWCTLTYIITPTW